MLELGGNTAGKLASVAARELSGLFCIHKPSGVSTARLRHKILRKLSGELSSKFSPMTPRQYLKITNIHEDTKTLCGGSNIQAVTGSSTPPLPKDDGSVSDKLTDPSGGQIACDVNGYQIEVRPNLADLPSVSGPPVLPEDFRLGFLKPLGFQTSGVLVGGINLSGKAMSLFRTMRWGRTYQVQAEFGLATDTLWAPDVPLGNEYGLSRVIEKSTYGHLTAKRLEGLLVSVQASYMKSMLMNEKVDLESQDAYELAVSGKLLPNMESINDLSDPRFQEIEKVFHIYGIRIVKFDLPHFVLEIQCVGETEELITQLVHDIGLRLKTNAVTRKIVCVKHGPFTNSMGLLQKHWTHSHILHAIEEANKLLLTTVKT